MKAKPIQVVPKADVSEKIDDLAKKLRTSRAGFCEIALDYVLPKLESGEMQLVNGNLVFSGERKPARQAA